MNSYNEIVFGQAPDKDTIRLYLSDHRFLVIGNHSRKEAELVTDANPHRTICEIMYSSDTHSMLQQAEFEYLTRNLEAMKELRATNLNGYYK